MAESNPFTQFRSYHCSYSFPAFFYLFSVLLLYSVNMQFKVSSLSPQRQYLLFLGVFSVFDSILLILFASKFHGPFKTIVINVIVLYIRNSQSRSREGKSPQYSRSSIFLLILVMCFSKLFKSQNRECFLSR